MAEHASQGQSGADPSRRRVVWRRLGLVAGVAVLVAALLGGGLAWRLAMGGLPLSFLDDRVAAALTDRLPAGFEVAVGGTVLRGIGWGGPVLGLEDVVIADGHGERLLAAPELSVGLSAYDSNN